MFNCDVERCRACPASSLIKGTPVKGRGNPKAKFVLIYQSVDFGQYQGHEYNRFEATIDRLITEAGLSVEDFWIDSLVKCYSGQAKKYVPHCSFWIREMLDAIKPIMVGTIGPGATLGLFKAINKPRPPSSHIYRHTDRGFYQLSLPDLRKPRKAAFGECVAKLKKGAEFCVQHSMQ